MSDKILENISVLEEKTKDIRGMDKYSVKRSDTEDRGKGGHGGHGP